jgi:2-oxoglutarate dehydrogenase E2 component (dihydrolipoamide succinyltransferase)
MSRVDVIMPQMGESIVEGTVSRWMKQIGETVKRDEAILEISTDKVDAEIPSPESGVLVEIKVQDGETVAVETVVGVIDTAADGAGAAESTARTSGVDVHEAVAALTGAPEAMTGPALAETATSAAAAPESPDAAAAPASPAPPAAPAARPPEADAAEDEQSSQERLRRSSTPLVRRIAAEHGVDIARVSGSGVGGRVTKQDILAYIERGAHEAETAPAVPPAATPPQAAAAESVHPSVESWPGDEVTPMSRIRKLTADHMVLSRRVSAHVTSFWEVDYTHVARLRAQIKQDYRERGANPTYLAFTLKVVADNLRKHRVLNSSVSGDTIIYRKPINIGIAVALDWGLLVPVLSDADELSLFGIAKKSADLAERARTKRLNPDEVLHGTFTITNPGVFGSYAGAPIINQPQVAILCMGAIEKRPKVMTLEDGQDVIAIRTMGTLGLTFDHRIVDGADADRFLADVKRDLEAFPEGAV